MTKHNFAPFNDKLDRENALSTLRKVTQGADDGELYFERSKSETMVYEIKPSKKQVMTLQKVSDLDRLRARSLAMDIRPKFQKRR